MSNGVHMKLTVCVDEGEDFNTKFKFKFQFEVKSKLELGLKIESMKKLARYSEIRCYTKYISCRGNTEEKTVCSESIECIMK